MIPTFHYRGVILRPEQLRYAPHSDIIHPSVIATGAFAVKALGQYYLYYAPHDAPGGICLAFADAPEGPWHEYASNPVICRDWPPYHSVSHVSSPHAMWNQDEQKLFLYYHGENDVTRYAVSTDGVHFEYGGVAVDAAMFGTTVSEASYARVFQVQHEAQQPRYMMVLMGNDQGTRNVYLAWSADGRAWDPVQAPLVTPPPGTNQMGPGALLKWQQQLYLICFANRTDSPVYDPTSDLYLYRLENNFERATCLGMLMAHDAAGVDNARLNDPCVLATGERLYLYVNIGRRLRQSIGLAVADLRPIEGRNRHANSDRNTMTMLERKSMPDYDQWYQISRSEKIGINVFVESIIALVYSAVLLPGDIAVDGGANRARHTEPMRWLVGDSGLVMAFEPVPMLAADLRKRLVSAGNVRVIEKALGASLGSSPFIYVQKAHTRSGLKQQLGLAEEMKASIERIEVVMTTLDAEASELALTPSIRFIKLDLEGGEYDALRGSEAVMRVAQPLIILENAGQKSAEAYGYNQDDFFALFSHFEYQLFDIFGRPFTPDQWSAPALPPYLIAARRDVDVNFVQVTLPALISVLAVPYEQLMSH